MYRDLSNQHGKVAWRQDLWEHIPSANRDAVYLGAVHVDQYGQYHGVCYNGRRKDDGSGLTARPQTSGGTTFEKAKEAVEAQLAKKRGEGYKVTDQLGSIVQPLEPVASAQPGVGGTQYARNPFARRPAQTGPIDPPPYISDEAIERMLMLGEEAVFRVNLRHPISGEWLIGAVIQKTAGNCDIMTFTHRNPARPNRMTVGTTIEEGRAKLTALAKDLLDKGYDYDPTMDDPRGNVTRVTGNPPRTTDDAELVWAMGGNLVNVERAKELIATGNYAAEEKVDDQRAVMHIGTKGNRFFGRRETKSSPGRPEEKTKKLPTFAKYQFPADLGDTILDGGIYALNGERQKMAGAINSDAGLVDTDGVVYMVWDVIKLKGVYVADLPWIARRKLLVGLFIQLHNDGVQHFMKLNKVETDPDKIIPLFEEILARRGEGIMLKRIDAPYIYDKQESKPNDTWWKLKKEEDFDVIICGYTEAKPGKYTGLIGAVEYAMWIPDELMTSALWKQEIHPSTIGINPVAGHALVKTGKCSGMTDPQRRDFTANREKYLGQVMIVRAHRMLASYALELPRFIDFHDQKGPEGCKVTLEAVKVA